MLLSSDLPLALVLCTNSKSRYNTASAPAKFPGVDVANYAIMTRRTPSCSHELRKNHPHPHPSHTRLYCGIPFYIHSPSSFAINLVLVREYQSPLGNRFFNDWLNRLPLYIRQHSKQNSSTTLNHSKKRAAFLSPRSHDHGLPLIACGVRFALFFRTGKTGWTRSRNSLCFGNSHGGASQWQGRKGVRPRINRKYFRPYALIAPSANAACGLIMTMTGRL